MGEMRYTQTIQGNYGNSMHLNDSLLLTHIFLSLALHCWNPSTTRGEQASYEESRFAEEGSEARGWGLASRHTVREEAQAASRGPCVSIHQRH